MAHESLHQREYKEFNILRKSKLEFMDLRDTIAQDAALTSKISGKIKKSQIIKVTRFRGAAPHLARAAERRRIVELMGVSYIKDAKDKIY